MFIEPLISTKLFCAMPLHLHYLISYLNNTEWHYLCFKHKKSETLGLRKGNLPKSTPLVIGVAEFDPCLSSAYKAHVL